MITFREYCKTIKEDWGKTSPIPKEVYADVKWEDNFHWIDLGLPSGTLWADENLYNPDDKSGLWSWYEVMKSGYASLVPTKGQMSELCEKCEWRWNGDGYNVIGKNGNKIFFPASGFCWGAGDEGESVGSQGYYRTATPHGGLVWGLYFDQGIHRIISQGQDYGYAVRLVKREQSDS